MVARAVHVSVDGVSGRVNAGVSPFAVGYCVGEHVVGDFGRPVSCGLVVVSPAVAFVHRVARDVSVGENLLNVGNPCGDDVLFAHERLRARAAGIRGVLCGIVPVGSLGPQRDRVRHLLLRRIHDRFEHARIDPDRHVLGAAYNDPVAFDILALQGQLSVSRLLDGLARRVDQGDCELTRRSGFRIGRLVARRSRFARLARHGQARAKSAGVVAAAREVAQRETDPGVCGVQVPTAPANHPVRTCPFRMPTPAPFLQVARHVVKSVGVFALLERADRAGERGDSFLCVIGMIPLAPAGVVFGLYVRAVVGVLVADVACAPGESFSRRSAACGVFPLIARRKAVSAGRVNAVVFDVQFAGAVDFLSRRFGVVRRFASFLLAAGVAPLHAFVPGYHVYRMVRSPP